MKLFRTISRQKYTGYEFDQRSVKGNWKATKITVALFVVTGILTAKIMSGPKTKKGRYK